ncbi:unnamed protein product [Parnassius mnemosyne]|uniref:DDE Tnp4 domain-containing protein n=1 Tax=Parnassius mnemosyne TaxID=213953 RepID=A0AAV1L9I3_9NEOP
MPTPVENLWMSSEITYREKWNFPNAVAALDGKHILFQAPAHSGSMYYCYKKYFSTVLLALVDANYKFIAIDVGAYGKNSDANIFKNSNLGKCLSDESLNMPPPKALPGGNTVVPHVIIADEAFGLSTYLMRPYSRDDIRGDEGKKIFNYRLSRARNTVEDTFGILVKKFRLFERRLLMSHDHTVTVVSAICCLHNFLRDDTCYWSERDQTITLRDMNALENFRGFGGNSTSDALAVRNAFKEYFSSESGAIPWQRRRVRAGRLSQ